MEADPNMNFGTFPHYNHQALSFPLQHNGPSGFDGFGNTVSMPLNVDAPTGISFALPPGSSPVNMALSPARRLVHGPAWAIEWTPQEQFILTHGLEEFANDPVIIKYAKIAARLVNKTVRDVAMRCQWMKERLANYSSSGTRHQQHTETASSSTSQPVMYNPHINQNDVISSEVLRLLEENKRALDQISRNLEQGQVQNGALFSHVGSNIETIIIGINGTNSSLRRMPPVPVSINGDLFTAMWPNFSSMASTSSNYNLSEVPRRQSSC